METFAAPLPLAVPLTGLLLLLQLLLLLLLLPIEPLEPMVGIGVTDLPDGTGLFCELQGTTAFLPANDIGEGGRERNNKREK